MEESKDDHGTIVPHLNSYSISARPANTPYVYRPLDPGSIRLIHLNAATQYSNATVHCKIEHFKLERAPAFEALSYTWSDGNAPGSVLHVGLSLSELKNAGNSMLTRWSVRELEIGANCAAALQRLRPFASVSREASDASPRKIWLWVDAICIDQRNVEERNQQVKLMAKIYSAARQVDVYIGRSLDIESDVEAQDLIEHSNHLRRSSEAVKEYLKDLTERRWFWRAWTLQEISLAKKAVLFWHSREVPGLPWGELRNAVWLNFSNSMPAPIFALDQQHDPKALELLHLTRRCGALLPQDHIFARNSLMPEEERITIDYRLSKEQAFMSFAQKQMGSALNRGLDMLSLAQGTTGTPSWVPHWDKPVKRYVLGFEGSSARYHAGTKERSGKYGERTYRQRIHVSDSDDTKAIVTVYMVSELGRLSAAYHDKEPAVKMLNAWRDILPDWDSVHNECTLGAKAQQSLARSLCANDLMTHDPIAEADTDPPDAAKYADLYTEWRNKIETLSDSLRSSDEGHGNATVSEYARKVSLVCDGRRLFRQSNGDFGLAPEEANEGDAICIPLGGRVPFVIRKLDGMVDSKATYMLIGECYLDGWMYGEVYPASGERDEQGYRVPVEGVRMEEVLLC